MPTADDLPRDDGRDPWGDDRWADDAWTDDGPDDGWAEDPDAELAGPGLQGRPLWFRVAAWATLVGLAAFVLLELRYFFF